VEKTGQAFGDSITLAQLALRPGITAETIIGILPIREQTSVTEVETALADQLYAGYLNSQTAANRRLHQHDALRIPSDFSFRVVGSLSHEIVERLERAQPQNFGQARRLPGMTPAALSNLLVHLTATQQISAA
jgi:tRNA uridine 5-carboxymethylaminomethyl modification enzyme